MLGPWNHNQIKGRGQFARPDGVERRYCASVSAGHIDAIPGRSILRDETAGRPGASRFTTLAMKRWERFTTWPPARELKPLYLSESFGLSFDGPGQSSGGDAYISDPAKPVPFLPRPRSILSAI